MRASIRRRLGTAGRSRRFLRSLPLLLSQCGAGHPRRVLPLCRRRLSAAIEEADTSSALLSRLETHLGVLLERHDALTKEMIENSSGSPSAMLARGREMKFLDPVKELSSERAAILEEIAELNEVIDSEDPEDAELRELALEERETHARRIDDIEADLLERIVPRDTADDCNVVLEVHAGTGGAEASLFTAEMFEMYKTYASKQGWQFEVMEQSASEQQAGGVVKATAAVSDPAAIAGVYGRLKHENGVHRVQRVPETETQGRIHTSAMTVVVLPQPEEIDVEMNMADVRIDATKASGAGGQHVNTTNSAIRLTHEPTGITVMMQEERSQHRNKEKAFKLLKARLFDRQRAEAEEARQEQRSAVRATGTRSERIRTYNFPNDRVTDHRSALTKFGMEKMFRAELVDEFIDAMCERERADRMRALLEEHDGAAS